MKFTILVKKQLISKINELFKPFSEMLCALDDRCQSGDGKTRKLQMTWQPLIG